MPLSGNLGPKTLKNGDLKTEKFSFRFSTLQDQYQK
jgi:hypothetical protein